MRAYDRRDGEHMKSWVGGFGQAAVDALTGGPLAIETFSADEAGFHHYPDIFEAVKTALGDDDPWVMTGDAGLSYTEVFEQNTRAGVATVVPWRPKGNNPGKLSKEELRQAVRCELYDEYGIPRCRECGGFRSLEAQRLRAQAARFLEWFRICLRFGWLAGHKAARAAELRAKNGIGADSHQGLLFNRRKRRLDLPYGDAAVRCGLARAGPPPAPPPSRAKIAAARAAPLPPISPDVPF